MSPDPALFFRRLAAILEAEVESAGPATEIPEGQLDSLRTLEAIALIDEIYGVTVPSDELLACGTMAAVLVLVEAERGAQAPGAGL